MIDAKMVALMTERETLMEEQVNRQELLAEEKKRRKFLEEGYQFNASIWRESAALDAEVERSRRESAYIHQAPMRMSMMDAARKKAAALQRSLDTQHHNQALSPIHGDRAWLPAAAEHDAPNSPESDA